MDASKREKKIYNTYRFGEDGFDCITSSSADRFRLMEYVFSSRRSVQSRRRLRRCNFDILVSNDGDGEGTDNLEESQSSETDDNETDDDIDGDGSAKLSENKMDDNDVNDVKGSDDKAALVSAATVNMDLEMTDDDDDEEEEEEEENATIDEASNGTDSGIAANDESTISDSDVCDGEGGGGGDGCGSASAIAASATAASAAADSPENFSSHPSSKHEKSKSSSSVVPSSFKAPICIGSIPLKKLKLTRQEMEKIKQNVSAKTMPLKCSTPLLSLAAIDCHHDGKCYAHQLMYSNKSKINHSVMIRQINMTKPRAGKKRQYVEIKKNDDDKIGAKDGKMMKYDEKLLQLMKK